MKIPLRQFFTADSLSVFILLHPLFNAEPQPEHSSADCTTAPLRLAELGV